MGYISASGFVSFAAPVARSVLAPGNMARSSAGAGLGDALGQCVVTATGVNLNYKQAG
jgi:hypothetical protein